MNRNVQGSGKKSAILCLFKKEDNENSYKNVTSELIKALRLYFCDLDDDAFLVKFWKRHVSSHTSQRAFYRERVVTFSDNKEPAYWRSKRLSCLKFPCPNPNCRSVFTWKRNLTSHLRYQCGQQPRFKCPYCDYICKVKADIRKHIKNKHKNHDIFVIDTYRQWTTQWNTFEVGKDITGHLTTMWICVKCGMRRE